MTVKILECVHGLLWQSCGICSVKTEDDVLADIRNVTEEENVHYDYLETSEDEEIEEDRAYDLDDSMDF